MNNSGRPLSPHLSIYRWPITMTLSILHRASGVAMSIGLIVLSAWLMAIAGDAQSYAQFSSVADSLVGRIALIGWTAAFFFHLSNGVRHLIWDAGRGLEKSQASSSAWFVVVMTVVLTSAFWVLL